MSWPVEETKLGRIVVAPHVPDGYALFYTTRDYEGGIGAALDALLRERFGVEASVEHCQQVHEATVAHVDRDDRDATCDALWSHDAPAVLAIKVADCLPVSLIDAAHGVIANIHEGWRGAVQRIVDATLDTIAPHAGLAATAAWLGPTIRVCCFEVGEEVVDQFRAAYADADAFVDRSHPRPHIDVPALTAAALRARGVGRIHDSALCTRCEGSIFHSYRRDGTSGGRNLAILAKR